MCGQRALAAWLVARKTRQEPNLGDVGRWGWAGQGVQGRARPGESLPKTPPPTQSQRPASSGHFLRAAKPPEPACLAQSDLSQVDLTPLTSPSHL